MLLEEFLGLPFQIEHHEMKQTTISLSNRKQLIFADHFFHRFPKEKSYLHSEHIPTANQIVENAQNTFLPEEDLPIIFGNKLLDVAENRIVCGMDVPATLFFMLTRWEEHVKSERDNHERFSATASLAFKLGFLQRPIVDELVEMVWNMLVHLGCTLKRKQNQFQAIVTHDVDMTRLWGSFPKFVKKLGGDLLVRRDIHEFFFSLRSYPLTALGLQPDPFDTFNYLMDLSEEHNLRSHFFFMSGGVTSYDNFFDINSTATKNLITRIHERGHVIGFHPSYQAYIDRRQFEKELHDLQKVSPQTITCGRQHFLRFGVPDTWQIWEDNGLVWESSMGYPEEPGFRCGTCHEFPVFNILTRKQLSLREIPLTAMEVSYVKYKNDKPGKMKSDLKWLLNTVKKYNGNFVLLWHNSSFGGPVFSRYKTVYPDSLAEITDT